MVNELYGAPEPPGEGFDELLARLEAEAGITPEPTAATSGNHSDPLPDGFERIGASVFDRLAELMTWADILEPAGWTQVRPPDAATAEAWKRPGGTHPVSAKVLKAAPWALVNWSEDSGLPVGAEQKLTIARVVGHFNYGRDLSALAHDLVRGEARGVPAHVNDAIRAEWIDRGAAITLDTGEQANTVTGEVLNTQPDLAVGDFWAARRVLQHIHTYARAHRVSPWGVLGCMLARVIAATPPRVQLPALVGGRASLNTYVALVGRPSAGKGGAVTASRVCIDLPDVDTFGPGSGEGLCHLYVHREKVDGRWELKTHRVKVLMYAPEVGTMQALKMRQASTLFSEFNKAWMGEPLSWAYVDPTKQLSLAEHAYRFCLIVGVQPEKALVILEDADAGTPQRFLWMPTEDHDAPDIPPPEPQGKGNPLWHSPLLAESHEPHVINVCDTARQQVDQARLAGLRGQSGDGLDGHALLAQLKVAAALMVLDGRESLITDDDWRLARIVRQVSDHTRGHVINTLERAKAQQNRARGLAEADRALVVDQRRDEVITRRVGKSIMGKLQREGDWLGHNKLKHSLATKYRQHFEEVITALIETGQVEERPTQADHAGHQGTEYRKVEPRR
jgi:hypothetical protein